jgi:hypothetical protein
MVFMRKFGVFLFSVILFVSLLGLALSTSSNLAFTHPDKVKSWLNQSNLYGSFVDNAIHQAQQTAGGNQTSNISLNDTAVQQIARSTFSSRLLGNDVSTFVNSNYAWLQGKTATPDFRIDLTSAKQTFGDKVGDYVQTYLTNLPVCTDAQLLEINSATTDPLTLTCRPAGVIPSEVASQVTDDIANSSAFLSNPVITASNLDPQGDTETMPYYQNLSGLPKVYQFGVKIPLIAAIATLASLVGVIFIAKRHRNGLRAAAIVLALAGIVLVVTKFLASTVFNKIQHQAFNNNDIGEVQKALTAFTHHVQDQVVKVDLWFGIGYLVLAAIILLILRGTRQRAMPTFLKNRGRPPKEMPEFEATDLDPVQANPSPRASRPPIGPDDEIRLKRQAPTAPPMPRSAAPKRRKPPKLVQ